MSKNNYDIKHKIIKKALNEEFDGINKLKKGFIKSFNRSQTIHEIFIGILFFIHNGHKFKPVEITEEMVGKKFGDFSITRKVNHNIKKKKSKKVSK